MAWVYSLCEEPSLFLELNNSAPFKQQPSSTLYSWETCSATVIKPRGENVWFSAARDNAGHRYAEEKESEEL